MRSSIGGWVENKLESQFFSLKGLEKYKCAVALLALESCFPSPAIFLRAEARPWGLRDNNAPSASAKNSLLRETDNCTN